MTCKSCIHFDDCLVKGQTRYYGKIVACDDVEERCKFFKSKADVVKVRHGEWKKRGNEKTCSQCKFIYYSNNDEWSFCPNCGAKMNGKGD